MLWLLDGYTPLHGQCSEKNWIFWIGLYDERELPGCILNNMTSTLKALSIQLIYPKSSHCRGRERI